MCGITGKVYLDGRPARSTEIAKMTGTLLHRGPDDGGFWVEKNVGLGSRRLSVIDLTKAGHMPMFYDYKRYVIVYNGEVYNFQTEREELRKKGYSFKSNTDTEVILALYREYGIECLAHLRGMFAFAIYDRKEKTIFMARDRLGKKPLKYFFNGKVFIFASELKAILTQREVKREPDFLAIHHYLTFGYVPAPNTGFVGISKLEPGHYLFLDLKFRKLRKQRYWKPDFTKKLKLSQQEWQRRILNLLEESTRLRMIADVPVGAFLSGGVDSSAVVAMMSRLSDRPVKTFSIGYKEASHDETRYARQVADAFGTEHTTLIVSPESVEMLPELVAQFEEPFADSSMLVTYLISKMARNYVTVALNGDGGDENFAGYQRYNKQYWYSKFDGLPIITSEKMGALMNFIAKKSHFSQARRCYWIWKKMAGDPVYRYLGWNSFVLQEEKEWLYKDDFSHQYQENASRDLWEEKMWESGTENLTDQVLYADLTNYLPEDLLVKMDIASMAVSLEARSPLLDHKLVELAAKIPINLKIKGFGGNKYIFKKALRGILPDEILDRPKLGFAMPLDSWFKEGLNDYARKKLLARNAPVKKFLKSEGIKTMLATHGREGRDFGPKLWAILTLDLWMEKYFN